MRALNLLVPLAAASLTLPAVKDRGPARLPRRINAHPVGRGRWGYVWHPSHLIVAPLVVWMVAGPMGALALGVLVAGLQSQVRGWRHRAAARRLENELPVVLHDIARRLRAGDPAGLAFAEALGSAKDTVCGSYAASMLTRGEPLAAAITRWHVDASRVVRANVLDDLVHVAAVAERVGGLRAAAVEAVADLASERTALAQETAAQASQAKASATVMTIAPLLFSAQMVLRDPAASRLLLHTPVGWVLIGTGLSFDVAAWLWIRRATAGRGTRARPSGPTRRGGHPGLILWRPLLVRLLLAGTLPGRRLDALTDRPGAAPTPTMPALERIGSALERITVVIGVRLDAVGLGPRRSPRRAAWSTERRRRSGLAVIVLPPLVLLRPLLGVLAVVVILGGPRLHARIARHRQHHARTAAVGHTIELVRSALECGATPSVALLAVAEVSASPLRPALQAAASDLRQGAPFDEVVRRLLVSAPELRTMADVLLASSRLGLPVVDTLRGLALEARASRRREAETRARRLPVLLLFPVVCLTLPAFVLLTVAPLLLSGLGALDL